MSKLKAKRINVAEMTKFVLNLVENIVEKGENIGYQHFLLFPQCFLKPSLSGLLKVVIVLGKELMFNGKHPRTALRQCRPNM